MTEPEVRFRERLSRPNPRRLAVLLGACLAIVVGAAVTMGASPSTSPAAPGASTAPGATAAPDASGNPGRHEGGKGGIFDGRGRFGGRGIGAISISAISGSNVTLKTEDGWTRTIAVTSATTITKGGQTIAAGQLAVGDNVRLNQTKNADGSFTVIAIDVVLPRVAGKVTAVTADTITITVKDGTTRTITTTGSTTYRLGEAAATHADVTVGSTIQATGTEGSGTSFTATAVTIKAPKAGGTVTGKSATTITIKLRDGSTQTINVDAATTYQVAGVTSAGLPDVAVGMKLAAVGRRNGDGSLDATAIRAGNGKLRGGDLRDKDDDSPAASPSPTG